MFLTFAAWLICVYFALKIVLRKLIIPRFNNKTVWITGASSGLGKYLAREFSRRGVRKLILSARNLEELQRVRQSCTDPSKVQIIKLDMTEFENVRKVTKEVIEDLERQNLRLDIVVENAGVGMKPDFINFPFENHLSLINVNVHGPYNHIQSFLEHMIKNKTGQIVTIDSILGKFPRCNRSSYGASKHALNGMMDSLRSEVAQHGIKVTTICPGYIQSNVGKNSFAEKAGEKCGVKDPNHESGMITVQFANEAVKAIYRGQKECHVSRNWIVNPFTILLRGVWPDACFAYCSWVQRDMVNQNFKAYYSKQ